MSRDIYAFFDGNREAEKFEIHADDKENVMTHITLKDFSLQWDYPKVNVYLQTNVR